MRWTALALLFCAGLVGCFNPEGTSDPQEMSTDEGTTTQSSGMTAPSGPDGTTAGAASTTAPVTTTAAGPTTNADDTGTTDNDTTGDSTDTRDSDPEVECAACVTATPQGWSGPVVVAAGDSPPACAGAFTGVQLDALVDISAEAANCECSCGAADVDCGPLSLLYRQGCGAPITAVEYTEPEICHDNTPAQSGTNPFYAPVANTQSCPPVESIELPEATSEGYRLCGGTFVQDECSPGELCVPAVPDGFDAGLCIVRQGVHDCPPAYPEQQIVFDEVDDARSCTSCECEPNDAFECSSTLQVHSNDSCTAFRENVQTGDCVGSWQSFTYDEPTITGSCSPSGGEPAGDVSGAGPRTVCCQ